MGNPLREHSAQHGVEASGVSHFTISSGMMNPDFATSNLSIPLLVLPPGAAEYFSVPLRLADPLGPPAGARAGQDAALAPERSRDTLGCSPGPEELEPDVPARALQVVSQRSRGRPVCFTAAIMTFGFKPVSAHFTRPLDSSAQQPFSPAIALHRRSEHQLHSPFQVTIKRTALFRCLRATEQEGQGISLASSHSEGNVSSSALVGNRRR